MFGGEHLRLLELTARSCGGGIRGLGNAPPRCRPDLTPEGNARAFLSRLGNEALSRRLGNPAWSRRVAHDEIRLRHSRPLQQGPAVRVRGQDAPLDGVELSRHEKVNPR